MAICGQANRDRSERISRTYLVEHAPEHTTERQGSTNADHDPAQREPHYLCHDLSDHVAGAGTECHAQSELERALAHGLRDHAVDADAASATADSE
jgi:hypothetical protein